MARLRSLIMFVSIQKGFIILVLLAEGFLFIVVSTSSNNINTGDIEQLHSTMLVKPKGISKTNIGKRSTMHVGNFSNYFQGRGLSSCRSCGFINAKRNFLILNGDVVDPPYKYPWMVRLAITTKDMAETFCGGSIINAQYILTAAHCLEDIPGPEYLKIDFLTNTHSYARGPDVQVIIMHPHYRRSDLRNDIGLVKLKNKIICDRFKNPICLPPANLRNPVGLVCTAAGWGATKPGPRGYPQKLREGKMKVVKHQRCAHVYGEYYMKKFNYCFDGLEGNWKSICEGDSGGPAFYKQNGKYYQIGIASSGSEGCMEQIPFQLTAFPKYVNWIKQVMASYS